MIEPNFEQDMLAVINASQSLNELDELRVQAFGKKGKLTLYMKELVNLDIDQRKIEGQLLNQIKQRLMTAIDGRKDILTNILRRQQIENNICDVTLPISPLSQGKIHPITQLTEECCAIMTNMGFSLATGPEIEDDEHNFIALNFPLNHPAREMHDTFFLPRSKGTQMLLRTHTSPVQIRAMRATNGDQPLRVVIPGRVYRCDNDQTHSPMFHQLEAIAIGRDIHMGHLRSTIEKFITTLFNNKNIKMRFRPSFFPFTEPSAEVDIGCSRTQGHISIGAGTDWLEVLGCGMIHPNVLRAGGYNPEKWQGFAWGIGLDRMAMLKYGIPDLRSFFASDTYWLNYYGFSPFNLPSPQAAL